MIFVMPQNISLTRSETDLFTKNRTRWIFSIEKTILFIKFLIGAYLRTHALFFYTTLDMLTLTFCLDIIQKNDFMSSVHLVGAFKYEMFLIVLHIDLII